VSAPWRLWKAAAERGEACASTAWNFADLASHYRMLGLYPKKAQDRICDKSPDMLIASALAMTGTAKKVAGGYELSGRGPFSTGVDNGQ